MIQNKGSNWIYPDINFIEFMKLVSLEEEIRFTEIWDEALKNLDLTQKTTVGLLDLVKHTKNLTEKQRIIEVWLAIGEYKLSHSSTSGCATQ